MAYTRKSEKIKNLVIGIVIGTIIAGGILLKVKAETDNDIVNVAANQENVNVEQLENKEKEVDNNDEAIEVVKEVSKDVVEDDLRIQDYNTIRIPSNIKIGDYVDVRIKDDSINDRVIIAKKKVINIEQNIIWFEITDIERKYMNMAISDQKINHYTIYVTKYVDPDNQKAAQIDYLSK